MKKSFCSSFVPKLGTQWVSCIILYFSAIYKSKCQMSKLEWAMGLSGQTVKGIFFLVLAISLSLIYFNYETKFQNKNFLM